MASRPTVVPSETATPLSPSVSGRFATILGPLGLVTLLYVLCLGGARVVGFGRESLIAYFFGATSKTDAYVAATALPEVVAGIFLAGVIGYVIIPRVAVHERTGNAAAAKDVVAAALGQVLLWCGGLALVCIAFPGPILSVVAPGLDSSARPSGELMLRISAPAMVLFGLTGIAGAMLNARHRFLPIPVSLFVGNAAAIALLGASHGIGVKAAAIAYVGAAAMTSVVQWALAVRSGIFVRPKIGFRRGASREVLAAGGLATLVVSFPYLRYLIERGMASTRSAGDLAALGFAGRTIFLVGAVVAVPVGTIAFPRLAEAAAAHDWGELSMTLRKTAKLTLALSIPATVVLAGFTTPLVQVLFEHGRFGTHATNVTASILRIYAIAVVPMALTELLLRAFFVLGRQRVALAFLAATFGLNIAINVWLLGRVGVEAVAIGAAAAIWVNLLLMGAWLIRTISVNEAKGVKEK